VLQICDADLMLLHEFNCCEKLGVPPGTIEAVDIDHIPSRNALAVATSDSCISIWSIVNASTGAYVLALKLSSRYPPHTIKWCSMAQKLFVSGAKSAHLWDIESKRATTHLQQQYEQQRCDRFSDIVELGGSPPMFATASFDHSVTVWEYSPSISNPISSGDDPSSSFDNPRVMFELVGHAQAILTLDYLEPVLLSTGFEFEAYCWSVPMQSLRTKLSGHHHSLIGARFVSSVGFSFAGSGDVDVEMVAVVTGDQSGHFKLWDVTRCVRGYSTDLAMVLQSFDTLTPSSSCGFHTFAVGFPPSVSTVSSVDVDVNSSGDEITGASAKPTSSSSLSSLCDVIAGNFRVLRFRAITQSEERRPPHCVVFNAVTNTFVGAIGNNVAVWNANSGVKLEEPVFVRDAEICGLAFDLPRERKLFVATNVSRTW